MIKKIDLKIPKWIEIQPHAIYKTKGTTHHFTEESLIGLASNRQLISTLSPSTAVMFSVSMLTTGASKQLQSLFVTSFILVKLGL